MRLPLASAVCVLGFLGCASPTVPTAPTEPLQLTSIEPTSGSVAGGTRVTLTGRGFYQGIDVDVGPAPCTEIAIESATRLSCTTGSSNFVEDKVDVAVFSDDDRSSLEYAYEYFCPWTTSTGRRSCGAAPPEPVTEQPISSWVLDSSQTMGVATDGTGVERVVTASIPATDMRGSLVKVWLQARGVAHAAAIDLWLGTPGMGNAFKFRLASGQGQKWMTEGDMVSFSVAWSPEYLTTTGSPDRGAIEELAFHVRDDGTGVPVELTIGGVALVPEPTGEYPNGLLSFTFDDNWSVLPGVAAEALAAHDFAGTAYVIIDYIDRQDRATHDQLKDLQLHGWDVAVHAFTGAHHDARFPTLPAEVVEDDLVDARAWLMRYGFNGHHHCAYPGGDFSYGGSSILAIAGRYFTSCRTIYQRQREAIPPSDPLKLRVFYVTSGTSLAQAKLAVDRAKASHEWIILVFHRLDDGAPTLTT